MSTALNDDRRVASGTVCTAPHSIALRFVSNRHEGPNRYYGGPLLIGPNIVSKNSEIYRFLSAP